MYEIRIKNGSELCRNLSSTNKAQKTHDLCDTGANLYQLSYEASLE